MDALDPERVERAADELRVCRDGLPNLDLRDGLAKSGGVPRHSTPAAAGRRRAAAPSPRSSPGCRAGRRRPRWRPPVRPRAAGCVLRRYADRAGAPLRPARSRRRARAPRDAGGDRGAQHVRWAFDHADHRDEGTGDGRVVLGRRAQPAQIGVDEAHARGPRPRDLGQRQVGADRQLPGVIDRGRSRRGRSGERGRARRARGSRAARPPGRRPPSFPARRWG